MPLQRSYNRYKYIIFFCNTNCSHHFFSLKRLPGGIKTTQVTVPMQSHLWKTPSPVLCIMLCISVFPCTDTAVFLRPENLSTVCPSFSGKALFFRLNGTKVSKNPFLLNFMPKKSPTYGLFTAPIRLSALSVTGMQKPCNPLQNTKTIPIIYNVYSHAWTLNCASNLPSIRLA